MSLSKSGRSFSVAADESVLTGALAAGINLPHSCKGGKCGACRARLLEGAVDYPNGPPLGLADSEVAERFILLCQARARSDLVIENTEVLAADSAVIKRLPARIERVERWSHDVLGMFLRLPAAEIFEFEAGQYIDIMLPGGRRRSFSMASPPHDSRPLELHIRRVPGGEFTDPLFVADAGSALLSMEGPLGHFRYRPGPDPMLLIGGGTGLAPLKSILRHVIEGGLARRMDLYWGVRSERDLYAHGELMRWAERTANFRYIPVLSEASAGWRGRRGWVHHAVLEDFAQLVDIDIYASGPPAMIKALREDFASRGVPASRLSFDSFDYAPDVLERQRTMASTKA